MAFVFLLKHAEICDSIEVDRLRIVELEERSGHIMLASSTPFPLQGKLCLAVALLGDQRYQSLASRLVSKKARAKLQFVGVWTILVTRNENFERCRPRKLVVCSSPVHTRKWQLRLKGRDIMRHPGTLSSTFGGQTLMSFHPIDVNLLGAEPVTSDQRGVVLFGRYGEEIRSFLHLRQSSLQRKEHHWQL